MHQNTPRRRRYQVIRQAHGHEPRVMESFDIRMEAQRFVDRQEEGRPLRASDATPYPAYRIVDSREASA